MNQGDEVLTTFEGSLATATDADAEDTHEYFLVAGSINDASASVNVATDGTYTLSGDFNYLAKGEKATVEFNYVAVDSSGAENSTSDEATVSLTITGTDDAATFPLLLLMVF